MAFVSGGAYLTGASDREMNLSPLAYPLGFVPRPRQFLETADFCMDHFEFPNEAGTLPRASVTFHAAREACLALGKRLCTETEFERACGGTDGWHQPYGERYRPGACNNYAITDVGDDRWFAPSGAFFECVSPEGIYDLEGNLSEWVEPPYPLPPSGEDLLERVVRGGTMWWAIYGSGCHARHTHPDPGPAHNDDGFRCCMDPYSQKYRRQTP